MYFKRSSLDDEIRTVVRARKEFNAMKTVPAVTERRWVEYRISYGQEWYDPRDGYDDVVVKDARKEPDERRKACGRKILEVVYSSSKFVSPRYLAGHVLGKPYNKLEAETLSWIERHVKETPGDILVDDLARLYNMGKVSKTVRRRAMDVMHAFR